MRRPRIAIVTPYGAASNSGNWHTAARWARLLAERYRIRLAQDWEGEPDDALIALHARRSADSISKFAAAFPGRPLIVALTGTDLYRDIRIDHSAQRSLGFATRLVVLNERAPLHLPSELRAKCLVIFQSARALSPAPKPVRTFRVALVGHLRDEKNPQLAWRLLQRLPDSSLRIFHAGRALDPELAKRARAVAARDTRYRWLGDVPRAQARQLIRRSHVLLHPSHIEGGAAVIIEAVTAQTAVIASRIDGHIGLLGSDYPGLFDVDDDAAAAALLLGAWHDPRHLARLQRACAHRAMLFAPEREQRAWFRLLGKLL